MDITFFSKCLKDLVIGNDVVTVPGLGSFIAKNMPADFSDQGRTINPPYRKLSFRAYSKDDGSLFVEALRKSLPAGKSAETELIEFLNDFKRELNQKKSVTLDGLGTMRATAERDYFFVVADDMEIYPEGVGLKPISIKTHGLKDDMRQTVDSEVVVKSEQSTENEIDLNPEQTVENEDVENEDADGKENIAESIQIVEDETIVETEHVTEIEGIAEPEQSYIEPEWGEYPQEESRSFNWRNLFWILIAAAILFLVAMYLFQDTFSPLSDNIVSTINRIINRILYTEEELQILNNIR